MNEFIFELKEIIKRMAESEGFEPPIPFQVRRFSRPMPSTTRPALPRLVKPRLFQEFREDHSRPHVPSVRIFVLLDFDSGDRISQAPTQSYTTRDPAVSTAFQTEAHSAPSIRNRPSLPLQEQRLAHPSKPMKRVSRPPPCFRRVRNPNTGMPVPENSKRE